MVIISIGGAPGSGKSTVGRMLAEKLNIPFFSMGDIRRQYAQDRGMTLAELNTLAESDPASDHLVDEYQAQLPKQHESFVIDSRLGFHFIPKSVKIYITVDRRVAAERIFNQRRESEHWHSVDDGMVALAHRESSDAKRYMQLYGVTPSDLKQYDLVLDATTKDVATLLAEIVAFLRMKGFLPESVINSSKTI